MRNDGHEKAIVVGAGVAGLSAAHRLALDGTKVLVLERAPQVGGLCATLSFGDFRYDIGGHRFFTKNGGLRDYFVQAVNDRVETVGRRSSIYFGGKLFDYPLSPVNALVGMGPVGSLRALGSFVAQRGREWVRPKRKETFEDWVTAQFGKRLYETFFKGYTEKVWGISCTEISADWAAQRIRGLNLGLAVKKALGFGVKKAEATLAEEFLYPTGGFGELPEGLARLIAAAGGEVRCSSEVVGAATEGGRMTGVTTSDGQHHAADLFVLTAPLPVMVGWLPGGPQVAAAAHLRYRGLVTVGMAVDKERISRDHWTYFPDPDIGFGRMHEPKNWSPSMAPDDKTLVVLEYFAFPEDPIWAVEDEQLVERTAETLRKLGLVDKGEVSGGRVDRWRYAYPTYDMGYETRVQQAYDLFEGLSNTVLAGRTGMFRYHNADHAIETGFEAAACLLGAGGNPFGVNTAPEYHEE